MTRHRAVPLPPGVAVRDAWSTAIPIEGDAPELVLKQEVDGERRPKRQMEPCRCDCRCGADTLAANGLCFLCGQGTHHVCSRSCRAYEPVPTVYHGIKALTNYVPLRRACSGGEDSGPRRAAPGARRHR